MPTEPDYDALLEHIIDAVMNKGSDPISVLYSLRQSSPDARILTLIRALLQAEDMIAETFNGNGQGQVHALLARSLAALLTEAADDHEGETGHPAIRLSDLSV